MKGNKILIPLNNHVLIKKVEEGEKIVGTGGLILGETNSKQTIPEGKVIEKDKNISEIEKGDDVVFIPHNTYEFLYQGEKHYITSFNNIVGKYNKWQQYK